MLKICRQEEVAFLIILCINLCITISTYMDIGDMHV